MTKHWIGMLMLAGTMAWANPARSEVVLAENKETGMKATAGMDIRLRLDGFSRSALGPAWDSLGREAGPDIYFYRMRTRPWLKLNYDQDIYVYARMVNDWRDYGSRSRMAAPIAGNDNNPHAPNSPSWPDEAIIDNLYLHWGKIAGTPVSLRLGRQDMYGLDGKPVIGNGMVVMDGTPYDGSRSGYFDGARLMYETETDTVNLFAFYSKHRDDDILPIVHRREHMLRDGNESWMAGIDWKRNIHSAFNVEAYYIYSGSDIADCNPLDLHDRRTFMNNPLMVNGSSFKNHTVGARIFGNPDELKWLSYSLEYARQIGSIQKIGGGDADLKGDMLDARIGFKIAELINGTPEPVAGKPAPSAGLWDLALNLSYTQFGGDDRSTNGTYEGWIPTWTAYPIWTEEMTQYLNGGCVWSNFRQYRAELTMKPMSKLSITPSYAYLQALEQGTAFGSGPCTGNGDEIGHLFSVFSTYQINSWWKATIGYNYFIPGDFFNGPAADAEPAHWFRLETTFKF